jgi:hypothetical protein
MPALLLRSVRRRTTLFETNDIDMVCETNFRDKESAKLDLRPSVFNVDDAQLSQTHSEILASAYDRPDFKGTAVNLSGIERGELVPSVGKVDFTFTRTAHREIDLPDEDHLKKMVGDLLEQRGNREHPCNEPSMRAYVKERLEVRDTEWVTCCEKKPKWRTWANKPAP